MQRHGGFVVARILILSIAACSPPGRDPFPEPCDFAMRCGFVAPEHEEACMACVECFRAINPAFKDYDLPDVTCEQAEEFARAYGFVDCSKLGSRALVREKPRCWAQIPP